MGRSKFLSHDSSFNSSGKLSTGEKRSLDGLEPHVEKFEEFLGDEKYSLMELEDIHTSLLLEIEHRFGTVECIHFLGKVLLGFQMPDIHDASSNQSKQSSFDGEPASLVNAGRRVSWNDFHDIIEDVETHQLESSVESLTREGEDDATPKTLDKRPSVELGRGALNSPSVENLSALTDDPRRKAKKIRERASFWKPQNIWKRAAEKLEQIADPWADRGIHLLAMDHAKRMRWNFCEEIQDWEIVKDDVLVKMERRPFAAGAMRECFAMKKLSTFAPHRNWDKASNMVAKRYRKPVRESVYYDDVLLQMDSKRLGDMYNATRPPKKVDFLQACVLQFTSNNEGNASGEGSGDMYCVEHLIEGDYIKYNSNSGFVDGADEEHISRNTPQAFSHFTFSATNGQKMVVDVQGVGDLYTDPQIHSADGIGYGEGNLGYRGMALFFRTHTCNPLCNRMALRKFPRCEADLNLVGTPVNSLKSSHSGTLAQNTGTFSSPGGRPPRSSKPGLGQRGEDGEEGLEGEAFMACPNSGEAWMGQFQEVPLIPHMDAHLHWEVSKLGCEVVLLPELHPDDNPDDARHSARFHLRFAAACGHKLALLHCAKWHSGCDLQPCSNHFKGLLDAYKKAGEYVEYVEVGLRCMELAAERGVRNAALAIAHAYSTAESLGSCLGKPLKSLAVKWYKTALEKSGGGGTEEEEYEAESFPGANMANYEIQATLGKMYMEGGDGLEADGALAAEYFNEAAEGAMEAFKGKLAQKYYEQAAIAESM